MDDRLKAYARQRRQAYGVPKPVPVQREKELLTEVSKVYGTRKQEFGPSFSSEGSPANQGPTLAQWVQAWWPRLVWSVGTVGVLAFVCVLVWRAGPPPPSSLSGLDTAPDRTAPILPSPTPIPSSPNVSSIEGVASAPAPSTAKRLDISEPAPSLRFADTAITREVRAEESDRQSLADNTKSSSQNSSVTKLTAKDLERNIRASAPQPLSSAPASAPSQVESGNLALTTKVAPATPAGSEPTPSEQESRSLLAKQLASEIKSKKPQSPSPDQPPIQAAALEPITAPPVPGSISPAPALLPIRSGDAARTGVKAQRYVRLEWGYRRNLNSPPLPSVLQVFSVEVQTNSVRIVDEDGSVLTGQLSENPTNAALANATQPFRVEGRSLKLGVPIEFDGEFVGDAASARIQGRVKLQGRQQFPITARPLAPH